MPRVRLDVTDHSGRQNRAERPPSRFGVRIDTDVFATLSAGEPSQGLARRPTIERWLDCWSG